MSDDETTVAELRTIVQEFVDDVGGNLMVDDFLEDRRFAHAFVQRVLPTSRQDHSAPETLRPDTFGDS